jgi:transcriptional regulator with XRE-family HTH domain
VLGQRLIQLRKAAGLSQLDLAAWADLSLTTISDLERGAVTNPRLGTLEAIAEVLKVPVAQLLDDPEVAATP